MNGLDFLHQIPLIAILRGVKPTEVVEVAQAVSQSGIRIIEIPLNSPDPYTSIGLLNETFPDHLIGAGTVMASAQVDEVFAAGGRLIVMPHGDASIIYRAKTLGMICLPGVATPSEGFAALACGADGLKLFPAEQLPPPIVKAWRAVFMPATLFFPVGGITPESIASYLKAGASGFGLGSQLYKPGMSATLVAINAKTIVSSFISAK